jgi:hypothetical protein
MSGSARIQSTDAVGLLAGALRRFAEENSTALIDLELELNRALQWVHEERRDYWADQVRRAWEKIDQARQELDRCLANAVADQRPSCHEERKALERAKRRLRFTEEKVEAVRRWTHTTDRESLQFRVASGQLSGWLQAEFPQALASLGRMANALESYVAGAGPAGASPPEAGPQEVPPAAEAPASQPGAAGPAAGQGGAPA